MKNLVEKEAKSNLNFFFPRQFTASARAAFTHFLLFMKRANGKKILLPGYIGMSKIEGSGVFDPVKSTSTDYSFYRVNKRLAPDLEDLKSKLATDQFGAVLLIHYFGFAQVDVEAVVALCREYNVLVIEDCAHTIEGGRGPGRRLGTYGDISLFSIHKSTATKDGGFFYDLRNLLKSREIAPKMQISPETLKQFASFDLHGSSERRRLNYDRTASFLRDYSQIELFCPAIEEQTVPLNCPVIVGEGRRESLYFSLQRNGVLATALYHTLIPEISEDEHPDSFFVAKNILNLPTHQDMDDETFHRYLDVLRDCIHETFREPGGDR